MANRWKRERPRKRLRQAFKRDWCLNGTSPKEKYPRSTRSNGKADGADRQRKGRDDLPPGRRRSSQELVANGDEHRHQQVFPREAGNERAGRLGAAIDWPRSKHDCALGPGGRVLRFARSARRVPRRADALACRTKNEL